MLPGFRFLTGFFGDWICSKLLGKTFGVDSSNFFVEIFSFL